MSWATWGKQPVRNSREFRKWVKSTTDEILNAGCEDEKEIHDTLTQWRPPAYPAVAVWQYARHQIFVEWVTLADFAFPPTVNSESPDSKSEGEGAK